MSKQNEYIRAKDAEQVETPIPFLRPFAILLCSLLGIVLAGRPLYYAYQTQKDQQEHLAKIQEDYQVAQKEYQSLVDEYQLVQDPAYLADIARRDYYYTKPGEITFILNDEDPQP